ncbi:hypothetical protein [Paenibacillus sp. SI8]|uniref:hypothetical protein n=1 Tax=unclassified Paenibacillus TaxID=185978 RepID=UPI00346683D3
MDIVGVSTTEHQMIINSFDEYGDYYRYATESIDLLNGFIASIRTDAHVFMIFLSQIQKSSILAVLSTLRRHDVQALMTVRHLLESSVLATYSFIEHDLDEYAYTSKNGYAIEKKKIKERARKWLNAEFPEYSNKIKQIKGQINDFYAHANLLSAFANYEFSEVDKITLRLFDKKEDLFIKQRLWWIGNICFGIMDLFIKVNQKYPIITLINEIDERMISLARYNNKLQEELMSIPNFTRHVGKTLE